MSLRSTRRPRPGVVGAPVVRTTTTVDTLAAVARGIDRRHEQREHEQRSAETAADASRYDGR